MDGEAAVSNPLMHPGGRDPLPHIKVEMVQPKIEVDSHDIVCDVLPEQSIESLLQNQELARELTSDDVIVERVTNQDVIVSESKLAPVGEGNHSCVGCGKKYKSNVALRKHQISCDEYSDDIADRKCSFCPHSAVSKENLRKHVEMKHSGDGRFPCTKCGRTYKRRINLRKHALSCDKSINGERYKCSHCSYECKWMYALDKHFSILHPAEAIKRLTCSGCGKFFAKRESLRVHQKRCRNLNFTVLIHKCSICSYQSKFKYNLWLHMKCMHTVTTTDRLTCGKCGRGFKYIDNLEKHEKNCDRDDDTFKFRCSRCPYKARGKKQLTDHMRRIHAERTRDRPKCAGCGNSFKAIEYLRRHLQYCEKSNSEIVKHKCSLCLYESKRKGGLKDHMKRVHPVWDRLTCPEWGKSLIENYLKVNMRYNAKSMNDILKYKCYTCFYETKYKNNLKKHINALHPFEVVDRLSCAGWEGTFVDNGGTEKNSKDENSYSIIVKYKCFYCPLETERKKTLKGHMKRLHTVGMKFRDFQCNLRPP